MGKLPEPAETLDLTGIPCPQNTARVLLKLEWMDPGEVLEIIIDDGEPKENVPPELEDEGHTILASTKQQDRWKLLVKRGDD